jgi:DNA-binding IclR family transcriptional regulator
VGALSDGERRAWDATYRLGDADADDVAAETGTDRADARDLLETLWRRRLVMRVNGRYVAVGGTRDHG